MKVLSDENVSKLNLFAKFRHFIEEWQIKSPKEQFIMLYNIPKTLVELVGVRVFGNCHVNWYSYYPNCIAAYYVLMVTHTFYYFGVRGQFMTGTRCLCGVGIVVSVILITFFFSKILTQHIFFDYLFQSMALYYKTIGADRFKFRSLLNFAGDYMYEEKKNTSRFSMVCEENVRKMWKFYLILTCAIFSSMTAVAIGPTLHLLSTGIWLAPIGTQFPYADESKIAFYADLIIQIPFMVTATITTVDIELIQVVMNNAVEMSVDVIHLSIIELNEQLIKHEQMQLNSRARFHNIILQIQDFDRYQYTQFVGIFRKICNFNLKSK